MISNTKAKRLQPGDKPLTVGGVTGLYLHASSKQGVGKFMLRFKSPASGKRRDMGLGTYPEIGLAEARRRAMEARELIAQGVDPIDQRKELAASSQQVIPTFQAAAEKVFETLAPSFRNQKHRDQWINTLRTYVFPKIGNRSVDNLTVANFAEALQPIWLTKEETASRVKQRCDRVMMWCVANRYCDTNPLSAVDALLPKQRGPRERVEHHPAAPWRTVPGIMMDLSSPARMSVSRQALLYLILTATRSGEVRGATWSEIDFETATWTIPPERIKARRPHRIPLSRQAMQVLRLRQQSDPASGFIFSARPPKRMSDMTLTKFLRVQRYLSDTPGKPATAHGFRSSFRDWASENGYSRDAAERALSHTISNATEAAYHRTDQLDLRRSMMQAWADFVFDDVKG